VAFPSGDVLREIVGHNICGAAIGHFALGEYIYCEGSKASSLEAGMQIRSPEVVVRFPVASLVSRRSFIFARAGFGKSNLNKLLFSTLYAETPTVTKRGDYQVPVGTVIFDPDGARITIRASKTDQEQAGAIVGLPYGEHADTCPVRALRAWLAHLDDDRPPVFRRISRWGTPACSRLSAQSVALIVKRHAAAVGQDPRRFAGHSLRAGLATSAAAGGATERDIMRQTRHRSVEMVRRYIREGELFHKGNAARFTGL